MAVLKQRIDGIWMPVSEQNRIVDAVYYVGEDVILTLKRNSDGLTDTAYLSGSGATKDYTKDDVKPWEEYIPKITAIYIGAGVTSLGAYLFAEHTAVKSLTFEDSSTITHLGDRCFWRCQFGGEFSFPGLTDATLTRAFAACVNLKGITVSDHVSAVGDNAFNSCVSLERVSGLRNVEAVGKQAFLYTPRLRCVDLDPTVCRYVDTAAFCISSAMSHLDMNLWAQTLFGHNACASSNWSAEELATLRAVKLPNVRLWNGGADANHKYDENAGEAFLIATWNTGTEIVKRYLDRACKIAALSIVFNIMKNKQYTSVGDFWLKEVYSRNPNIGQNDQQVTESLAVELVGLVETGEVGINGGLPAVKQAIAEQLRKGSPTILNLWTTETYGHSVAIIGANTAADKLIVSDSVKTSGTRGIIYEVALEDIIGVNDNARIEIFEVAT